MTIDKERLRVLAEAATPGPWILLPVEDGSPYLRVRGARLGARYKVANVLAPTYFMPRDGIESTANAEFIAAARDAVPALLSENAALAAEVERLRKDAGRVDDLTAKASLMTDAGELDALYPAAIEVVRQNNKASVSLVQRHLRISYNRAARLLEAMEKAGLISVPDFEGRRTLLPALADKGGAPS